MMRGIIITFLFLLAVIAQDSTNVDGTSGDLTLILTGFENEKGEVRIALNDSEENYDSRVEAYRGVNTKITNKQAIWVFEQLPYGEYAIKVYHDEDNDEELDKNFLGIPTEDYGFSNNARGSFGPAKWEDAKFIFNTTKDTITIIVK